MKPPASIRPRRESRPGAVAEAIKGWIVERGLSPGDRLPQEPALIAEFGASKGAIREALKVLETQGLIRTRTGPGGGAFITEPPEARARALLGNFFFFKDIHVADIYELRRALEPELAAGLAGRIDGADIARLEAVMTEYRRPPRDTEEERRQRIAELEFHETLAALSPNPLLSFTCGFLVQLLKDLTVCRRIYERPNPELRERGLRYQARLIDAFRARDAEAARAVMAEHMQAAQALMEAQEARLEREFLKL